MKRTMMAMFLLLMLAGCTMDPCTFDKASPSCAVSMSQAQATVSAIDADRFLKGTQSAIFITREAEKSNVDAQSTRQIVNADATQAAMNIEATRSSIGAQGTAQAIVMEATRTNVQAEATKVAVQVGSAIVRANVESAATPYNAVFNVVVFWFLLPVLVVLAIIVYGQRTVKRVTEAAAAAVTKRAGMVKYGPENDPRIGFITFDSQTGQPIKFITSDGMIGSFADLLTGGTTLNQLDVPDQVKLLALVEASKRTTAAHIAAATGTAPWSVTTEYAPTEQAEQQALTPGYQINVVSSTLPPLPQWLDEVDRRLLEAHYD